MYVGINGDIPEELFKDILKEADKYLHLDDEIPSQFLEDESPQDKRAPIRKMMTRNIVKLSRPRFGKRSGGWERSHGLGTYNNIYPSDLMTPFTKALFDHFYRKKIEKSSQFDNYGKNEKMLLLNLTKPRYGKRAIQDKEEPR